MDFLNPKCQRFSEHIESRVAYKAKWNQTWSKLQIFDIELYVWKKKSFKEYNKEQNYIFALSEDS